MKNIIGAVLGVTTAFVLAGNASAASSVYTDEASFKAASGADPLSLNEFGDITTPGQISARTYTTGSPIPASYRVATGGFGAGDPFDIFSILNSDGTKCVGVSVMPYGDQSLQIDMLSGGAAAVGGNFFNTDQNGDFSPNAWLAFTLSDGTVTNFLAGSTNSFFGFVSGGPSSYITQVKVFNKDLSIGGLYPTASRLYVVGAVQVPEPSVVITNLAVLLSAGMGAVYYRRRNAVRN